MRILFLTHRLPYAPNRGDRVRAYHVLRRLSNWATVDLLSFVHDDDEASHIGEVRSIAASVTTVRLARRQNTLRAIMSLPSLRPLTHVLLDAPGIRVALDRIVARNRPDVVLAYCSGMARFALEAPLRTIPLVLDMVDVDSAKWAALARVRNPPRSWLYAREARTLARFEALAAQHATASLVVNGKELETLRSIAPDARVEVVQNGVDAERFRPPHGPAEAPVVIFCGVMDYAPNEAGAVWLARNVWPLVRARRRDARLLIVGSRPTRAVRRLASQDRGIGVTGHVPDVRPYLWRAAVGVAPLLTARGVQNKVLEAIAAGLPCVVTPVVHQGLPAEVLPACVAASGPDLFADEIVRLLDISPIERRQLASDADLAVASWERRLEALEMILHQALTSRGSRAGNSPDIEDQRLSSISTSTPTALQSSGG